FADFQCPLTPNPSPPRGEGNPCQPDHRDFDQPAQIQSRKTISDNDLGICSSFFYQGFSDEIGANEGSHGIAIENVLDAAGLDKSAEAELQRPAPGVGHQVAA